MQKNIIITVLAAIVVATFLWPAKQQPLPAKNDSSSDNSSLRNSYPEFDEPNPRPRPRTIPPGLQRYPNQDDGYAPLPPSPAYTSPYNPPYTQSYIPPYSTQPYRPGQVEDPTMYPQQYSPQQSYAPDASAYPQYYVPRYRFRNQYSNQSPPSHYNSDEFDSRNPPRATSNPNWEDNQSQQGNSSDSDQYQQNPRYTAPTQAPERYLEY